MWHDCYIRSINSARLSTAVCSLSVAAFHGERRFGPPRGVVFRGTRRPGFGTRRPVRLHSWPPSAACCAVLAALSASRRRLQPLRAAAARRRRLERLHGHRRCRRSGLELHVATGEGRRSSSRASAARASRLENGIRLIRSASPTATSSSSGIRKNGSTCALHAPMPDWESGAGAMAARRHQVRRRRLLPEPMLQVQPPVRMQTVSICRQGGQRRRGCQRQRQMIRAARRRRRSSSSRPQSRHSARLGVSKSQ